MGQESDRGREEGILPRGAGGGLAAFFVGQPWEVVMLTWKQSWPLVLSQAQLAVVRILLVASHRNLFELSSLWPSGLFPRVFRVLSFNRECAVSVWPQCWEMTLAVLRVTVICLGQLMGHGEPHPGGCPDLWRRKKQVFFGAG